MAHSFAQLLLFFTPRRAKRKGALLIGDIQRLLAPEKSAWNNTTLTHPTFCVIFPALNDKSLI